MKTVVRAVDRVIMFVIVALMIPVFMASVVVMGLAAVAFVAGLLAFATACWFIGKYDDEL